MLFRSARGAAGTALVTPDPVSPPPGTVTAPPFRRVAAPPWCEPWAAALDSLLPPGSGPAVGRPTPSPGPHLGRLDMEALAGALPPGPVGTGTPAPTTDAGACLPGPWNWGDPREVPGVCGAHAVARFHAGDVVLAGGMGQGLLAVRGNLTLKGTQLRGLVLVDGTVSLLAGAAVDGQVRASGPVRLDADARIRHAPCEVVRALSAAAPLLRVLRFVPEAGWLEG